MPAYPDFDRAGIGYDVHLWHPEWGSQHVYVGTPSFPPGLFDTPGVEEAVRAFAAALVPAIGGERVIEVVRLRTEAASWQPPEPEPEPSP
ncbi:hypothetical protein [Streptomyces cinereoruber]|uniref:hypothetical protein n=1 Tax=Streptomyces cinereoruber TaxID=67260 RepID=UPI003396DA89